MIWRLEKQMDLPLYQQIIRLVEKHIEKGELLPGEKLPPERKLAEYLDVNRSTVVRALDELAASGKVIRTQGSGTRINEAKWGLFDSAKTNWRHYVDSGAFNTANPYLDAIQALKMAHPEKVIDLATGELPIELTPQIETPSLSWQSFLAEELNNQSLGYLPLREAIGRRMFRTTGLRRETNQLLVTSGAQQAIFLITQCLLKPGDAVAIEAPSYFYSLPLFQSAGLRIFALPMDEAGAKPDELEQLYRKHRIKMVFTNPTFQNPTGNLMTESRRRALVSLCAKLQIPIVEDDPFGELHFQPNQRITPLKKLDEENVLYIGSFSKILGSTTRIGWLDGPAAVVNRLAEARQEMDFGLSIFPQILARFVLESSSFERHLSFLRAELKKRRDLLVEALEAYLPGELQYKLPHGGFHLWIELPRFNQTTARDFNRFLDQKLLVMPGFVFGQKGSVMRLTFARVTETNAKEAAKRFAEILEAKS